jgi:NAD(P)-dependent dehydrogenase (short-subunit alcohol dehydrogenase family)
MPSQDQDRHQRPALVTGATGAIGKAIALEIARHPDYRLVLLCRDRHRAAAMASEISTRSGNEFVSCQEAVPADVSEESLDCEPRQLN